jgi:hypothetical protein
VWPGVWGLVRPARCWLVWLGVWGPVRPARCWLGVWGPVRPGVRWLVWPGVRLGVWGLVRPRVRRPVRPGVRSRGSHPAQEYGGAAHAALVRPARWPQPGRPRRNRAAPRRNRPVRSRAVRWAARYQAGPCRVVQCRAAQCQAVRCQVAQYRAGSCRVAQYRAGSCRVAQYRAGSCRVAQCRAARDDPRAGPGARRRAGQGWRPRCSRESRRKQSHPERQCPLVAAGSDCPALPDTPWRERILAAGSHSAVRHFLRSGRSLCRPWRRPVSLANVHAHQHACGAPLFAVGRAAVGVADSLAAGLAQGAGPRNRSHR